MKSVRALGALLGLTAALTVAGPAVAATYPNLCSNVSCSGNGGKPLLTQVPNGFNYFLQHPEIIPLFWESTNSTYWDNALSTRLQIVGAIQAIVHGPYFAYLEQYAPYNSTNGQAYLAPPRMVPMAPVYNGTDIPSPWTDNWSVVQTAINGAICQGKVPPPVPYTNHIYAVFVPANTRNGDFNNASIPGQDNVYTDGAVSGCTGYNGKYNGDTYSWTFVNATDFPGLFHELVEDIAGNMTYNNCTVQGNSYAQIADLCECDTEAYFNGTGSGSVSIGAYWSEADQECVIPEAWSGIGRYDGSPQQYTVVQSSPVRQVYAGGFGLMATDRNDNPILYSGTPNVWTGIGSPGSMFAVGATSIMELSPDASTISLYAGAGFTTVPSSGATSIAADGVLAGTDTAGNVYEYNTFTGQWSLVGGSGDQFVVSGSLLVGLLPDHSAVYANSSGTTSGWNAIGGAAEELFAGQGGILAATGLAATKNAFYWLGSTNWSIQNGPAMMFALTTTGNLFAEGFPGVTSGVAYPYVVQSSNTNINNPTWNPIEPGGWYYLVGHGSSLYFAAGLVF